MSVFVRIEQQYRPTKVVRLRGLYHEICLNSQNDIVADEQGKALFSIAHWRSMPYVRVTRGQLKEASRLNSPEWIRIDSEVEICGDTYKARLVSTEPMAEVQSTSIYTCNEYSYLFQLTLGNFSKTLPIPVHSTFTVGRADSCQAMIDIEGICNEHFAIRDVGEGLAIKCLEGKVGLNGENQSSSTFLMPYEGGIIDILPSDFPCHVFRNN